MFDRRRFGWKRGAEGGGQGREDEKTETAPEVRGFVVVVVGGGDARGVGGGLRRRRHDDVTTELHLLFLVIVGFDALVGTMVYVEVRRLRRYPGGVFCVLLLLPLDGVRCHCQWRMRWGVVCFL